MFSNTYAHRLQVLGVLGVHGFTIFNIHPWGFFSHGWGESNHHYKSAFYHKNSPNHLDWYLFCGDQLCLMRTTAAWTWTGHMSAARAARRSTTTPWALWARRRTKWHSLCRASARSLSCEMEPRHSCDLLMKYYSRTRQTPRTMTQGWKEQSTQQS